MSRSTHTRPDDAPMLLSPLQIAGVVIVFLLFLLLGRAVGGWLDSGSSPAATVPAAAPTATPDLAETTVSA
ncbi:MAG: hypothetical protein ACR2J8_13010 [Thermomicrobiales bacterium]